MLFILTNHRNKREKTFIVMKTIVFFLNICEALVGQTKLVNLIFEGDESRITVKLGYNVQNKTVMFVRYNRVLFWPIK
jgi:hypothetical protein